jgi:hypothetical protein
MTNTVVQLRPLGDDAALALLRGGEVFTSAADFGRRVGWNRQKSHRRIKAWTEAGQIGPRKIPGKTTLSAPRPRVRGQRTDVTASVTPPSASVRADAPAPMPMPAAAHARPPIDLVALGRDIQDWTKLHLEVERLRTIGRARSRREPYNPRMLFFVAGVAFYVLLAISAVC